MLYPFFKKLNFQKDNYMKKNWQPIEEKIAERDLIKKYALKADAVIIKLQEDEDDGGTDGILKINGEEIPAEARRKGYPNHRGVACNFPQGWESYSLKSGIFLNESTIRNYIGKKFIFIVEIKGFPARACLITAEMNEELLKQPYRTSSSTNSHVSQSVKTIPLNCFKEF